MKLTETNEAAATGNQRLCGMPLARATFPALLNVLFCCHVLAMATQPALGGGFQFHTRIRIRFGLVPRAR